MEFRAEECVVCLVSEPTFCIRPCSHICLCKTCQRSIARTLKLCPLCRTPIKEVVQATKQQLELEPKPLSDLGHSIATRVIHSKPAMGVILKMLMMILYLAQSFDEWHGTLMFLLPAVQFVTLTLCFFGLMESPLGRELIPYILYTTVCHMLITKPILQALFGLKMQSIFHKDEIWATEFVWRCAGRSHRYSMRGVCKTLKKQLLSSGLRLAIETYALFPVQNMHQAFQLGVKANATNQTFTSVFWHMIPGPHSSLNGLLAGPCCFLAVTVLLYLCGE